MFLFSSAIVYFDQNGGRAYYRNLARNAAADVARSFVHSYPTVWNGKVVLDSLDGTGPQTIHNLNPGQYRIRFSALKHFGNPLNDYDYEVYDSPAFNLVF